MSGPRAANSPTAALMVAPVVIMTSTMTAERWCTSPVISSALTTRFRVAYARLQTGPCRAAAYRSALFDRAQVVSDDNRRIWQRGGKLMGQVGTAAKVF